MPFNNTKHYLLLIIYTEHTQANWSAFPTKGTNWECGTGIVLHCQNPMWLWILFDVLFHSYSTLVTVVTISHPTLPTFAL